MNILSKLAMPMVVTVATMTVCFVGITGELTYARQSIRAQAAAGPPPLQGAPGDGHGAARHLWDAQMLAALGSSVR